MGNTLSFKKEFGLILVGAIIFTASFLWKDLLTDIEERFFPKKKGITGRIFYTVIVTIILVLVAVHLRGVFGINDNKSPIKFDDQPLDDEEERVDIGLDNIDPDNY